LSDADDIRSDEISFMNCALESWAAWCRGGMTVGKLDSVALYASEADMASSALIPLNVDQLTDIDHVIASLEGNDAAIIDTHYRKSNSMTMKERRRLLHVDDYDYDVMLMRALRTVYDALMPAIRAWRLSVR
jgi:hypothetical protein